MTTDAVATTKTPTPAMLVHDLAFSLRGTSYSELREGFVDPDPNEGVSKAKQRVLDGAAAIFQQYGYKATTMRVIAERLDLRQATLYHHAPGGKDELYAMAMDRIWRQLLREIIPSTLIGCLGHHSVFSEPEAESVWLNVVEAMGEYRVSFRHICVDLTQIDEEDSAEHLERLKKTLRALLVALASITVACDQMGPLQSRFNHNRLVAYIMAMPDTIFFLDAIATEKDRRAAILDHIRRGYQWATIT